LHALLQERARALAEFAVLVRSRKLNVLEVALNLRPAQTG